MKKNSTSATALCCGLAGRRTCPRPSNSFQPCVCCSSIFCFTGSSVRRLCSSHTTQSANAGSTSMVPSRCSAIIIIVSRHIATIRMYVNLYWAGRWSTPTYHDRNASTACWAATYEASSSQQKPSHASKQQKANSRGHCGPSYTSLWRARRPATASERRCTHASSRWTDRYVHTSILNNN